MEILVSLTLSFHQVFISLCIQDLNQILEGFGGNPPHKSLLVELVVENLCFSAHIEEGLSVAPNSLR